MIVWFIISIGLLCLACLIPTKPRRVSRLSEAERLAWVERDRVAGWEKERQAALNAERLPGGFDF